MSVNRTGFNLIKSLFSFTTLLFAALMVLVFIPGKRESESPFVFVAVSSAIWLVFIWLNSRNGTRQHIKDITYGIFILLIIWELSTRVLNLLTQALFPTPESVFQVFINDYKLMWTGLFSSLYLLFVGFSIALILGNLLGLFVGWNDRLRKDFYPIAKVLCPIPPTIYTPYLIAILPTFGSASIAVVAFGLFWPTFMTMINLVGSMDRRIIDSAKAMGVGTPAMLLKVILPYQIPGIISGFRVMFSATFMVLVMAEMIGAQSGLGFFIKKFSDYADYTRVAAGIIFIGIVITVLNVLITLVEKKCVKWKTN
ncbi:MAG: ABC transporter permease subunit [Bacillota bacterium]|nr:ABC transporter permease subunit [Bacillota bacterium]